MTIRVNVAHIPIAVLACLMLTGGTAPAQTRVQPQAVIKQGPLAAPVREDVCWVGNSEAKARPVNWSVYLPPDEQSSGGICCRFFLSA